MENDILVSICCLTYNHEKYIRETLDGILNQKVDFKYEILIHDDASTDNTAGIIKEYEKKYSQLIKPIYQEENKYSRGIEITDTYQYSRAKGKYIALCEGDDYWTDENKLAKQVSYLEIHPECSCTFHAANYLKDGVIVGNDRHYDFECDVSTETIIKEGGNYCATASLCYRKDIIMQKPKYMLDAPIGDYPTIIWLAVNGKVHYFPKCMSVYRIGHAESWSSSFVDMERKELIRFYSLSKKWLLPLDVDTNYKYRDSIYYIIARDMQELYLLGVQDFRMAAKIINDRSIGFEKKDKRHLKLRLVKTVLKKYFPHLMGVRRK